MRSRTGSSLTPRVRGLVPARFHGPAQAVRLLRREALLETIDAARAARLVLLRGPPGHGKTSLLVQWSERLTERGAPFAWLSLDRDEATPGRFLAYLTEALRRAGAAFDADLLRDARRFAESDPVAATHAFVAALKPDAERRTLLLDGLEWLGSGFCAQLVDGLLRYRGSLQIVATTQRRPALALAGLRAAGLLAEIGPLELRFSLEEVALLCGDRLHPAYAQALLERTDGVAVALRFAMDALEDRRMAVRWTDWLDEYYREQVLEQLPLDLQRVISRLVIVEHFDPSLARAIVGHDVGAVLERLHYEEGLLSVDARTGLLQFPALLRESLCKRLQWLDATELTALHRRAGAWFAERGLYNEALYHALAAGDAATAVPLFQRIGGSAMLMRSGLPTLRAALEQMQSANTVGPEVFGWSRVLLLSQEGQSAEAWRVARSISPDQDSSVPAAAMVSPAMTRESREGAMIAGLLAAYVDQRLPADRAQALQRIGAQLPQQEHIYHGFISTVLCWLKCEQAEFGDAAIEAERAILEFTADNGLYGSLFMHLHRVVIRYWQNRLDEALAEAEQLARLKRLFFPEDLRFDWLCRVFRAFVLFELGRLDAAAELLKDTVEGSVASEGWPEPHLIAYQTSAKIAAARGDFAAAEDILRQGEHIARERSLPRLQWHLRWQLADLRLTAEVNARLQPELEFRFDPEQDPEYFTWRERFLSAVISTRHATHERDYEGAGRILDQIESELALTDVPRAGSQVALLRARIAAAQGDSAGADRAVRRAMSTFGGVLAVQLFREAGFPAVVAMAAATNDAIAERSGGVAAPPAMLTQREREILDLLAAGHPNKIVAHQVGVSEATVKFHLKNIYRKLKARNRVQALARHRQTAE